MNADSEPRSHARLRAALIGAGRRGQAQAATIAELSDLFDFVAIADTDEAQARRLAARHDAQAFGNLGELFSKARLDVVVIVTPPENHHLVAALAARHGVHMLVETPLALTRATMDVIAEASATARVQVEVGENYGRRPAEILNRRALAADLIGNVVHLSAMNAPENDGSTYHGMSLLRLYAGADVAEVQAVSRRQALPSPLQGEHPTEELWTDALLWFENDLTASVSAVSSWTSALRWGRPRIFTVEGSRGYIVGGDPVPHRLHRLLDGTPTDAVLLVEKATRDGRESPWRYRYEGIPDVEFENPFVGQVWTDVDGVGDGIGRAFELASLHRAITTGGPPEYGIAEARRSQELGIAIVEAGRQQLRLAARLGPETDWEREQHEAFRERWGADPVRDVDLILRRWTGARL